MTTKKLKTFSNLLICNTCLISLFYSFTTFLQIFMVSFAPFHLAGKDTRLFCIVRAYLTVVSTTLLSTSFLLQALNRMFYSVFYAHHQYLLTWKFHYLLIAIQWTVGFLTPITILINHKDVVYRQSIFCTIPLNDTFHLCYLYSTAYLLPALSIFLIYITIIYRVNYYSSSSQHRHSSPAREAKLLNNILIFVAIFIFGGVPSIVYIFMMSPNRILSIHFFILALVSTPLAVAMEKMTVLWLHIPFRKAFIRCCCCVVQKRTRKSIKMIVRNRTLICRKIIPVD